MLIFTLIITFEVGVLVGIIFMGLFNCSTDREEGINDYGLLREIIKRCREDEKEIWDKDQILRLVERKENGEIDDKG